MGQVSYMLFKKSNFLHFGFSYISQQRLKVKNNVANEFRTKSHKGTSVIKKQPGTE